MLESKVLSIHALKYHPPLNRRKLVKPNTLLLGIEEHEGVGTVLIVDLSEARDLSLREDRSPDDCEEPGKRRLGSNVAVRQGGFLLQLDDGRTAKLIGDAEKIPLLLFTEVGMFSRKDFSRSGVRRPGETFI